MRGFTIARREFLRRIPKHVLYALLLGALTGLLLYWLMQIRLPGRWQYAMLFPLGGIFVNGATLPVAIPGRHWSFAFISAMMLVLLLLVGGILSSKFTFAHSVVPGAAAVLVSVNFVTFAAILTGACLGLFYGILAGRTPAMVVGAALGGVSGYALGLLFADLVSRSAESWDQPIYEGALHYAWQFALGLGVLHLAGALGAGLGTAEGEKGRGGEGEKTTNR